MSDDSRPEIFLQWKGTDACIDLYCLCGEQFHFDGFFASELTCGLCGQTYELPHMLKLAPVEPGRQMKIVFDGKAVLGDGEFTFTWPRASFAGVRPGGTFEIYDEPDEGCHRGAYVKLVRVVPQENGTVLVTALNSGQHP